MQLHTALDCISSFPPPAELSQFARDVPMAWIEEALAATGTATLRKRRLPVEQVPWLVIGMALYRDRPITDVVNKLDLALPSPVSPTVAPSAVVQARDRLGEAPMAWLFCKTATEWAHTEACRDQWRGLSLYGSTALRCKFPTPKRIASTSAWATAGIGEKAATRSCAQLA